MSTAELIGVLPLAYTKRSLVAAIPSLTDRDVTQCLRGTHPTLPPLNAKYKSAEHVTNQPMIIPLEEVLSWLKAWPNA